MIDVDYLATSYDRNVWIVKKQTENLSHEESLIQLPFRANCMNWVVGHIVTNRNSVLKLLNAEDQIATTSVERYLRDTDPIMPDSSDVVAIERLIQLLEQAQANIAQCLLDMSPEELDREVAFFGNRVMTVGQWLLFFFFHDCYHTGQTEILRQAAGKDDKVI
jgi:uncharacterized damage-inducible protein DinB